MPPRPLRSDKYYPGSPWGDRPPDAISGYAGDLTDSRIRDAPIVGVTEISGLRAPIIERETAGGPLLHISQDARPHIDAYFEYYQMVGESDNGRLMAEADYEALRQKAADPSRRLWVHWVQEDSGLECKAIGPSSLCFCEHRYREHNWADYPETRKLECKMAGCPCAAFHYVPVRGSGDLKCSSCRQSFRDHDKKTKMCSGSKGRSARFTSSYSCSCNSTYDRHATVVQTNAEREEAGKATGAAWMGTATASGLPSAHLGGVSGFTSLADGIDRALAGLEPGFEPENVHAALAGRRHGIEGLQQANLPGARTRRQGAARRAISAAACAVAPVNTADSTVVCRVAEQRRVAEATPDVPQVRVARGRSSPHSRQAGLYPPQQRPARQEGRSAGAGESLPPCRGGQGFRR